MFIGIDVGTAGIRGALFDKTGKALATHDLPLRRNIRGGVFFEQSSDEIVAKSKEIIRKIVTDSRINPDEVRTITFDATCSLVVLDRSGKPLPVSPDNDTEFNIIMWCDHRATEEQSIINATRHRILDYLGGTVSVEHELPKILWLKRQLPDTWARLGRLFDLADFLSFTYSGVDTRSTCTNVCKWGYLAHEAGSPEGGFKKDFFNSIGLTDFFVHISQDIKPLATSIGTLQPGLARELGLSEKVMITTGIIDAHAGGAGSVTGNDPEKILVLIGGTSSCHMATSREPIFVKGVWGPYKDAMLAGLWLNEGGQSASGALIEHVIKSHPAFSDAEKAAREAGEKSVFDYLTVCAEKNLSSDPYACRFINILPYFHGNRSPNADAHARGIIDGLTLDTSVENLVHVYIATCEAVALGTRDIMDAMETAGHAISQINICGSHAKNRLLVQLYADICEKPVMLMESQESMLLGCAVLGAIASGEYGSFSEASANMIRIRETVSPRKQLASYYRKKLSIMKDMYREQLSRKNLMKEFV